VPKVIVSKGRTEPVNGKENSPWLRALYTIEYELPENVPEDMLKATLYNLEKIIDERLAQPLAPIPQQVISMEDIEKLPWIRSPWVLESAKKRGDTDKKAKPGEDAWIKRADGDYRLEKMIEDAGGKLELAPYTFSFAGRDNSLIVRKVSKK